MYIYIYIYIYIYSRWYRGAGARPRGAAPSAARPGETRFKCRGTSLIRKRTPLGPPISRGRALHWGVGFAFGQTCTTLPHYSLHP